MLDRHRRVAEQIGKQTSPALIVACCEGIAYADEGGPSTTAPPTSGPGFGSTQVSS